MRIQWFRNGERIPGGVAPARTAENCDAERRGMSHPAVFAG